MLVRHSPCTYISSHIDKNFLASNLDGVALQGYRRVHYQLSGGHVVLPAVPGTSDGGAGEPPLAEGAAAVEADIVDGVKLACDVGDGHRLTVNLKFADGAF